MPAGSSPLSSPLSQVSTLSDLSDEDAPLETRDLGSPGPAGVDAAAGPSRSTRRSSAAKRVAADAAATGGGKRKRSTTPGSSAVKRPKTRTASSSLAVKAEQLASSSSVGDQLGQTQPPLPVQRRSARGSILPPTSPLKLASPPPLMRKKPTAVASKPVVDEPAVEPAPPPPTKRTTAKRPPPAAPAPLAVPEPPPPVAVEPTPGPARLPSSPPPVPVQQAPVVVANGKKAGRDSIASLMSAPPTVNASVSQASVPAASLPPPTAIAPSPPAEAAPSAPPPKLRSEPGVEWIAGRETCPMCRDAPTIPVQPNAQPRRQPDAAATDDDVTMAEGSMNALGLSAGQGAMQAASPATVVESSTVPDPAIIVDSWLSCVKCKRWHHWECIRSRYPQTLPEGLLALSLPDSEAAEKIDRWYCAQQKCSAGKATLKKEPKEPKRASSRAKPPPTYAPSDDDSNAPSPTLPSFDLPAGPAVPIPTAGDEHNFHRRVSQWPALYATYEQQGRIIDGGYRRCTPEDVVDEWAREDDDGWRRGGGIVLVDNVRSPGGEADAVEGGEGIAFERLGGRLPDRKLTVADVARIHGPDKEIEVLSVDTQNRSSAVPGTAGERWTLAHWARYYAHPAPKVLFNIISYEITGTTLGKALEPPKAVKEISWVDRHWPGASAPQLPPVQRYLLMSPAGTFTDWHVDMAASSVYYHVVRGEKVFYFIRPTVKHLTAYRKWASTEKQTMEWLGNSADAVYKVVVKPGATAFIPAGWIHAVYTPKDSLVYGGNFVHTLAIPMQLRVCEIEVAHGEEDEHRFPYFIMLCWFVAKDYTAHLASLQKLSSIAPTPTLTMSGRSFEALTPAVLESLLALARFLCDWVERRVLKKLKGSWTLADSKQIKRDVSLKDPFSLVSVQLANEFRSRVVTQLKALGQPGDESAADLEAREAELTRGAQQTAGSSSTTARRTNGNKDKSPRSSEGPVEEWTEPEITKYATSRPRPGAPAGAPSEPAMCTEEKQHQFQRHNPHHRLDGSVTLEFAAATRVKYVTTWAPLAVPPAGAAAPPAISAAALPATLTPADPALKSKELASSAAPLATAPVLPSSTSPAQAPAPSRRLGPDSPPSASAGPINGHSVSRPPSNRFPTSGSAAAPNGEPSRAPSSSTVNGQRPNSSVGGDTSRPYEYSNRADAPAGPSYGPGPSTASTSVRPASGQRRPSANDAPSQVRAATSPADRRQPPTQPKSKTPLFHPPMMYRGPPLHAQPAALPPQQQQSYPGHQAGGSSQPLTAPLYQQQQTYYPTTSYALSGAFYEQHPSSSSSSSSHAQPASTTYSTSRMPSNTRPLASGPYGLAPYHPTSSYTSQSSASHSSRGAGYDAGRRVSPPKPDYAQAAASSSSAGPPHGPADYQPRPSAHSSAYDPSHHPGSCV